MPTKTPYDFDDVTSDTLLLVEGVDDAKFFDAFLRHGLNAHNVQVARVGDKDSFRPFLTTTLNNAEKFANLRRLGIIRDADTSAEAALTSLRSSLSDAQMPAPERPWGVAQSGDLRVSIALMPDVSSNGNLEELCIRAIEDPLLECIDNYIDCITSTGHPIADNRLAKARVFAYLAPGPVATSSARSSDTVRRRAPGLRLGDSAEAGVWDWNSPAFAQVRRFLLDLAGG